MTYKCSYIVFRTFWCYLKSVIMISVKKVFHWSSLLALHYITPISLLFLCNRLYMNIHKSLFMFSERELTYTDFFLQQKQLKSLQILYVLISSKKLTNIIRICKRELWFAMYKANSSEFMAYLTVVQRPLKWDNLFMCQFLQGIHLFKVVI